MFPFDHARNSTVPLPELGVGTAAMLTTCGAPAAPWACAAWAAIWSRTLPWDCVGSIAAGMKTGVHAASAFGSIEPVPKDMNAWKTIAPARSASPVPVEMRVVMVVA